MSRKFKLIKIFGVALVCSSISHELWVPHLCGQESSQDDTLDVVERDAKMAAELEARFLTKIRQLTFEGRRTGEGHFGKDGRQPRAALRAFLGTVPDYAEEDAMGFLLSSVAK